MGQDKKSWEDIPSLDGLKVDWEFEPENPLGKRSYARLETKELHQLFEAKEIPVKLHSESGQVLGTLLNLSQGGVCLTVKVGTYRVSQAVKLGFYLGPQQVVSKGIIRNVRQEGQGVIIGIEFIGLSPAIQEYISGVYSSVKTKRY